MNQSCGGQKPNKTVAAIVPEPRSKLRDPVLSFQSHPDFRVEVAHNELVEGFLLADNLLHILVKSIEF